jgi:putative oxidoreductase
MEDCMTDLYKYAAPVARVLLALMFIMSGLQKLGDIPGTIGYIQYGGLPGFLIYPTILLEVGGGIALAVGYQARLAALLLAGFSLLAGVLFHLIPSGSAEGAMAQMQMIMFLKNVSIAGGMLMVVSMGAGAYSLDNRAASGKAQTA